MSRFRQAVHYVIASTDPDELGKTKLAKVLFFADVESFRRSGRSITGTIYEKRPYGPMPRELYNTINELKSNGIIAQRVADCFGYSQHQFWSIEKPDLEGFTADDVALLNEVTRIICKDYTAASISEFTHNADAWEFAREGEEIPLAAFLACQSSPVTEEELLQIEGHLGGQG